MIDGPVVLQTPSVNEVVTEAAVVFGLALVAAALSAVVALVYRWYVHERAPTGLPMLVGLSGVALYLNTSRALQQVIDAGQPQPFDEVTALFNIVTFLVSAAAARGGIDVGDHVGKEVFVATGGREAQAEVGRVVQAVGRVITVELPEEIEDIVGYDPVPDQTKETLAGRSFVFPRRLTVEELRNRLTTRLKADYAVGHVDMELTDDGDVEYLALGSRAAGIGPTLPPETSAVTIRADPPFGASAGDLVQVWRTDPQERLLTAEVRGIAGDVVTLAIDAADTRRLDEGVEYKLVTLPVEKRADREFASLLRAAEETMAAVTVEAGGPLVGQPIGALDVAVVAVRPPEGPVEPLPSRTRTVEDEDVLYLIAKPEGIRTVEYGVAGTDEEVLASGSKMAPEHRVGPATPIEGEEPRTDMAPDDSAEGRSASDEPAVDEGAEPTVDEGAEPIVEEADQVTVDEATGDDDAIEERDAMDEPGDGLELGDPDLADLDAEAPINTDETDDDEDAMVTDDEEDAMVTDDEEDAMEVGDDDVDVDDLAGVDSDDLTDIDDIDDFDDVRFPESDGSDDDGDERS